MEMFVEISEQACLLCFMSVEAANKELPAYVIEVCDQISLGFSVQKACDNSDISHKSFFQALRTIPAASEHYMRAREIRADVRFERLEDLLDDVKDKKIEPHAARVILDAIKWQCGKEKAKVYGDSTTIKGDKDNPIDIGLAGLLDHAAFKRKRLPDIEGKAVIIEQLPAITQERPEIVPSNHTGDHDRTHIERS